MPVINCKKCGKILRMIRDNQLCSMCDRVLARQSEKKKMQFESKPYPWKEPTDKEVAGSLISMLNVMGFGIDGPVIHYRKDSPEFNKIAAQISR